VPKAELEAKRILRRTYDLFEKRYTALEGREHDDLVLVDERNGVTVRPYDVGVGISQVLPVVVAALYRGQRGARAFVCVEQPELHIHPRLQVALADLFIEQSTSGAVSDHWFLLETHSEHILLRLLRRIRKSSEEQATRTSDGGAGRRGVGIQATGPRRGAAASMAREGGRGASAERGRGAAPPKRRGAGLHAPEDDEDEGSQKPSPVLTPDKVSVIYVQRGADGSTQFIPLRIDERGEFLDVWPEGFFDERLSEVF
jgi:hypothetical protein